MSGSRAASAEVCADCRDGWRHCHGTWVIHSAGGECTDGSACGLPVEAHLHVIVCSEVEAGCRCP